MRSLKLRSCAKINLSLDILGKADGGYHEVSMFMQDTGLYDEVLVRWFTKAERSDTKKALEDSSRGAVSCELSTNRSYLPNDSRNIAVKAAMLMAERFGKKCNGAGGKIRIDIKKNIPVAAGLAGGSGNAAACLHALNCLWGLGLSLRELMELGEQLGSDVPFCVMQQAASNSDLDEHITKDPCASHAALACGTGTIMTPVRPLKAYAVIIKPRLSVSTKEVYMNIDSEMEKAAEKGILAHPDNQRLIKAAEAGNIRRASEDMINILELYTLKKYGIVEDIKRDLIASKGAEAVLMSGSGPSVYALYEDYATAGKAYEMLKEKYKKIYLVKTGY